MRLTDARKKEIAFARKLGAQGQRQLNAIVKDARGTGTVLKKTLDAGKADLTNVINTELQATYIGHAGKVLAEPSMNISAADWELVNERGASWSRKYSVQQVNGMDARTQRKVQSVLGELRDAAKEIGDPIPQFFERQATLSTVRSQLQPVFGAVRSELIASTELTRAAYQGELAVIERVRANGFSMLGKWATSMDERTCPICDGLNDSVLSSERQDNIGLDGAVTSSVWGDPKHGTWNLTGIFRGSKQTLKIPGPPAHPRCRCWVNYELQTTPLRPKQKPRRAPAKKPLPPIPSGREARERILVESGKLDDEIAKINKSAQDIYESEVALVAKNEAEGGLYEDIAFDLSSMKEKQLKLAEQERKLRLAKQDIANDILKEGKRPSKITRNFESYDDLPDDVTGQMIVSNVGRGKIDNMAKESAKGLDWLEDVSDGLEGDIKFTYRPRRAYYDPDKNLVVMRTSADISEVSGLSVHEMAHSLEEMSESADDWYERGVAFRKRRAIDPETGIAEQLRPLDDIFPGGLYGPEEVAICDRYISCYMGKEYVGERASETFSMGLQALHDDAVSFAKQDPDMFDFIVDALNRGGAGGA